MQKFGCIQGGANITMAYFDDISLQYIKEESREPEKMGNSDFEEPTEEYKIPNWVPYLNPPVENTKVIVTDEEAYTGKYSIKLVDGNEGQSVGVISGIQNIIPDKTYIASVYAKMVDENKPGANLILLEL
ncbi:MAG: hypothetical protein GX238_03910 [Epulopiscium sp.]|nr:hypothetical protein [Candidatus Epulonipiscium sp.]